MYNPGITYHGDQALYQGIASAGRNIGSVLEEYAGAKKKENEGGKLADQMRKWSDEFAGKTDDETWKGLSSKDKMVNLQGFMQGQVLKDQQMKRQDLGAQMDERGARMGLYQQQAASNQQSSDQDAAMGAALQKFGSMPTAENVEVPLRAYSDRERIDAAMQTPGLGGRGSVQLMKALQDYQEAASPAQVRYFQDAVGGSRQAVFKNQMYPINPDPGSFNPTIRNLTDGQGNTRSVIVGPKGDTRVLTEVKDPSAKEVGMGLEALHTGLDKVKQGVAAWKAQAADAKIGKAEAPDPADLQALQDLREEYHAELANNKAKRAGKGQGAEDGESKGDTKSVGKSVLNAIPVVKNYNKYKKILEDLK